MEDTEGSFSVDDFCTLNLGDRRLRSRAIAVLSRAASQPHGRINAVFPEGAEREAAYRFVENGRVEPSNLVAAACDSAMKQRKSDDVFVVIDQTSLSFRDPNQIRGLGRTGANAYTFVTRGLEVMNAMVVGADGRVLGLAAQEWWVRKEEKSPEEDRRSSLERESINWVRAMSSSTTNVRRTAPHARITVVGDRGGDFYGVFNAAKHLHADVVIRSQHDRRLVDGSRLKDVLQRTPLFGSCHRAIRVKRGEVVEEVKARLDVRVAKVDVVLQPHGGKPGHTPLTALRVVEHSNRKRKPRVSWTLLTTWRVETMRDVERVLDAYCRRWRIEDFHRTWKRGGCSVEQAQLRSVAAVVRWATILAVVATRIERLKTLSRTEPDRPARDELSEDEVEALRLISGERQHWPKNWSEMTIGQAVNLIAYLGGWGGRSQGPAGSTTLGRGLERVEMAASVVAAIRTRPP